MMQRLSKMIVSAIQLVGSLTGAVGRDCALFLKYIGPPDTTGGRLPHCRTVICTAIVFVTYVLYTILVLRFAPLRLLYIVPTLACLVFSIIFVLTVLDFGAYFLLHPRRKRAYSRNLGNTMVTVLITVPLMTALYQWLWYPQQMQIMEQVTTDEVDKIQFPAVALLQRTDFSSQANLLPGYSKCFLGWYDETAPRCSGLQASDLTAVSRCNCNETWSHKVIENFDWLNANYRYLLFQTPLNLVSNQPTYLMMLQAFFNFNNTKALEDSSFQPSPSLSIAIYDPNLSLSEALNRSRTRLVDINALGTTSINLGITSRQALDSDPTYDYDLQISSVPARDLVCNVMDKKSYPCVSIIKLRFPTFRRTIVKEQYVMSWQDVYAAMGSFYSFIQFFSWVVSGALWAA